MKELLVHCEELKNNRGDVSSVLNKLPRTNNRGPYKYTICIV